MRLLLVQDKQDFNVNFNLNNKSDTHLSAKKAIEAVDYATKVAIIELGMVGRTCVNIGFIPSEI
ncbi:hypothetical protein [Sporosarcina sp. YIM B06819]|uniref:hypothetical protein n=1 Tax=Sporosarcina sp. YIM B06819 TaxID=3081769 RepID=UPI00298CEE1C|nr:hypothetical protein [Sporosarcina sp. YIM B06819]